jgi:hypothetical protein
MPMADRVVFQMDQTASAHKIVLWQICQCCEDPSMDCNLGLCACGDHKKTIEFRVESLHFFADFECYRLRESLNISIT